MSSRSMRLSIAAGLVAVVLAASAAGLQGQSADAASSVRVTDKTEMNAISLTRQGRTTFRFDTFGDEAFWGDTLRLHEAIEGTASGGVGAGVSPTMALGVGLKVDVNKLPLALRRQLRRGQVDLNSPRTTLALLRLNAVVGVRGFFNNSGGLSRMGITCALCHSTVDNSFAYGIGRRLDGFANRDLDVGAIINMAPDVSAFVNTLRAANPAITEADVRSVLLSWGPGKFDAELILDGKAMGPNGSGATLMPNAYDMAGQNLHTWTGFGSTPYWNAFVAILEMHGVGNFTDMRLNDPVKYPVATANRFYKITVPEAQDRVTNKLPGLQAYQNALPSPTPRAGVDFDRVAAARGDVLFSGKAGCSTCHVESMWTEPGHDLHTAAEMEIDDFQSSRSPENGYKTMNLAGLFIRERGLFMAPANRGRFYHDGRFRTLLDVVNSYDQRFELELTDAEKIDLVEYLKSL